MIQNQMLRLAMLKTIMRMKKKKRNNSSSSSCRPQPSPITGCNKWLITNLGTASRKEQNIHPFVSPAKGNHQIVFHPLDITVLNSWILLSLCGAKYSDRDFRHLLVRN